MRLQILVAEKDKAVRKNIREILRPIQGWEVCAEAENSKQAVEGVRRHKPDIVILDLALSNGDTTDLARNICSLTPKTEVVVIMGQGQEAQLYIDKTIRAGAHAFLLPDDLGTELVPAIESIQHGNVYIPPKLRPVSDNPPRKEIHEERRNTIPLTEREIQVLRLVAQGFSNKQTASELSISVKTVEAHRTRIMRKLGMHSVVELVHYAIREKIVSV
jgi:DNA-binding NarL/FixJ family response regulator